MAFGVICLLHFLFQRLFHYYNYNTASFITFLNVYLFNLDDGTKKEKTVIANSCNG